MQLQIYFWERNMEKQIGLTEIELEKIFAQLKSTKSEMVTAMLGDKVYVSYLPAVKQFAKKYKLSKQDAQDIFTDALSEVYNAVLEGSIKPADFNACFNGTMDKVCAAFIQKQSQTKFNSELLEIAYANSVEANRQEAANEEARISVLYTTQLLEQLKHNPELAASKGLSPDKIDMLEDYCGMNEQGRCYSIAELAKKYNVSEKRAQVMVVTAKKAVRHMKEFEPIMHGQKVQF